MTLASLTSPELVIPRLQGRDVASVIQELCQVLQREKRIPDLLPFYHAALNREFMVSTDVAGGMAFPHARLPVLQDVSFALGRSDGPLRWGMQPGGMVRLIFLSAVPSTDATQYLLLISGLARLSRDTALLTRLLEAHDPGLMLEVLRQFPLRRSPSSELSRATISRKPGRLCEEWNHLSWKHWPTSDR